MLHIRLGLANTVLLTSIINQDQTVFRQQIFAVYEKRPSIQKVSTTEDTDYQGYFVTVEIDVVAVATVFMPLLSQYAHLLMERLAAVDQGTGAAFSTLVPLLWACAVSQNTPRALAVPVVVIPGIVQNTITERIVARAISIITTTLNLDCPRPTHIFQLHTTQLMSSDSLQVTGNEFSYIHNNVCTDFPAGIQVSQEQYAYACDSKFQGSLVSSYTVPGIVQTPLSLLEQKDMPLTSALHLAVGLGRDRLRRTNAMPCPPNMYTQFAGGSFDDVLASVEADCFVCRDGYFFDISLRSCAPCDTGRATCEETLAGAHSSPCSWTSNLYCAFA